MFFINRIAICIFSFVIVHVHLFRWNCHLWQLWHLWSCPIFLEMFIGMHNFAHIVFSVAVNCIQNCPMFEGEIRCGSVKENILGSSNVNSWLCLSTSEKWALPSEHPCPTSPRPCGQPCPHPASFPGTSISPLPVQCRHSITPVHRILVINTTCRLIIKCSVTPWSDSYLLLFS